VPRLQARLAARAAPVEAPQRSVEQRRARRRGGAPPAAVPRLEVIPAQVGITVTLVPIDEVIYFEAADKYVRVVTADKEHQIRMSLKDLLPQLDTQLFWQVHRGTVVRARSIVSALRHESGKVTLTLRERPERLTASRLYAHLFKGM
jgi:DNA-binding LytR/AlgR family response regulator